MRAAGCSTDHLPRSYILHLPFRRTHSVTLADAIKQYISSKYDQHPDMFTADLDAIDALRSGAIHAVEPHQSGIRKLQAYAAQLVWIGGKFPVDVGAPVDMLGRRLADRNSGCCR